MFNFAGGNSGRKKGKKGLKIDHERIKDYFLSLFIHGRKNRKGKHLKPAKCGCKSFSYLLIQHKKRDYDKRQELRNIVGKKRGKNVKDFSKKIFINFYERNLFKFMEDSLSTWCEKLKKGWGGREDLSIENHLM